MISVTDATEIILQHALSLSVEKVPLDLSIGRVLQEDLIADRDFPPFDRVTMDGIAIRFDTWKEGQERFPIEDTSAAGTPQLTLQDPLACVEVMTGTMLPIGCDTVIRYEDLKITSHGAAITVKEIVQGQNIHKKASDRKEGDIIVRSGHQLSAAEIGIAATIGKAKLNVTGRPLIAIVSTGDELVDVNKTPLPHQLRKSNVYQIQGLIQGYCDKVELVHVNDNEKEVVDTLKRVAKEVDVLILSGGVSEGKFDYVPSALEKIGVTKIFHQVAQRPGKPFWFGTVKSDQTTENWRLSTVFALPGNPVSSFMCTVRYIIPWLEKSIGIVHRPQFALLTEDVSFRAPLTFFLQVRLEHKADGRLNAVPVDGHGSGDLANLVDADAFLELPQGGPIHHAGGSFPVWKFR